MHSATVLPAVRMSFCFLKFPMMSKRWLMQSCAGVVRARSSVLWWWVAEGVISKKMAAIKQEEKDGEAKVEAMLKTRTIELAANLEKLTGRETRVTIL